MHVSSRVGRPVLIPDVAIEGKLDTFSYVSIGNIEGVPIQSLCATFTDVCLLPDGDRVVPENRLHVPALAVGMKLQLN